MDARDFNNYHSVEDATTALFSRNQSSICGAGEDKNQGQDRRAVIAHLIGHRKDNTGQDKMHQCSRFPICKLEKGNHQSDKTGDGYHIKKCRHLLAIPLIEGQEIAEEIRFTDNC